MGWGREAGFAEALSQAVGHSVDRIARNADGAIASRRALQEDIGRLEGKKVVVWQFAARELSFGDRKVLEMPKESTGIRVEIADRDDGIGGGPSKPWRRSRR